MGGQPVSGSIDIKHPGKQCLQVRYVPRITSANSDAIAEVRKNPSKRLAKLLVYYRKRKSASGCGY